MAEGIVRRRPLVRSGIDRDNYTLSLLRQAFKKGLIDANGINGIRSRIMMLLKDLILRYTKEDSTSVRTETAERLLNSLYYTLDAYTCGIGDAMEALAILKHSRIEEIYKKGIDAIKTCVSDSKAMLERLSDERLEFGTEAYECLFDDLREFFRTYDVLYAAHDANASIDYPVLFDDFANKGVFYVRQYMEKLEQETRFIKCFRADETFRLLKNHGRQNRINYSKLMINIFELVLSHALYSVLSGGEAGSLSLSDIQCDLLEKRFVRLDGSQIRQYVNSAFCTIVGLFAHNTPDVASHVLQYEPVFLKNMLIALKNGTLSKSITSISKGRSLDERITLGEGERLSGAEFKTLISDIMKCDDISEKINIIGHRINAFQDFIDILDADCLFEDDYASLYRTMEDIELAGLGNLFLGEELRDSTLSSLLSSGENHCRGEWQAKLVSFLRGLSSERLSSISRIMSFIGETAEYHPATSPATQNDFYE